MHFSISFIILIIVVVIIFCIQCIFFNNTRKNIRQLGSFFPSQDALSVEDFVLDAETLKKNDELSKYLENPTKWEESNDAQKNTSGGDGLMKVSLICVSLNEKDKAKYASFIEVIRKTNTYLCKNVGTSADFSLIKDICERSIEVKEGEIQNTLSSPLYMGLGGTFIGIITGVFGVNLEKLKGGDINSVQDLLIGVGAAMVASLMGLVFTVINSTLGYKAAVAKADTDKDNYYDFIQRELMPTLSTSVASSLNALKSVLGNFVDSFGGNLDQYAKSIGVLNENIRNEKEVLEEINKLNLTTTAAKMAKTFESLKEASEAVDVFKSYEQSLVGTMGNVTESLRVMNDTVDEFKRVKAEFRDFSQALKVVVQNQDKATQLQIQFKNAIEKNFPSGSVGREIWEKEYDELFKASKKMSDELSAQLEQSTKYIQSFVAGNNDFFSGISQIRNFMGQLAKYADLQSACYADLKSEITEMRRDNKALQAETAAVGKSIIEAIQVMTATIKSLK